MRDAEEDERLLETGEQSLKPSPMPEPVSQLEVKEQQWCRLSGTDELKLPFVAGETTFDAGRITVRFSFPEERFVTNIKLKFNDLSSFKSNFFLHGITQFGQYIIPKGKGTQSKNSTSIPCFGHSSSLTLVFSCVDTFAPEVFRDMVVSPEGDFYHSFPEVAEEAKQIDDLDDEVARISK